jgi:hypothetical protein
MESETNINLSRFQRLVNFDLLQYALYFQDHEEYEVPY